MKRSELPVGLAVNLGLVVACAFAVIPLLWMLSVSFMQPGEANNFPPPLLPAHASWDNYRTLFSDSGMGHYLLNSLGIACVITALSVSFNVMAGYAFAKLDFRGREASFKALLAALVIPGQVAMMPLFLLLKSMGLINSWGGVIVPGMASIFGIYLVRQYALTLPDALLEAARIDGAGEFRIFVTIVLPMMKPVVVTSAVLAFLGSWNDFMWPLIVLSDSAMHTAPVALASLSREHVADGELMMAGSVVTVAPVLVLFLMMQRHYLQGLTMGAVK